MKFRDVVLAVLVAAIWGLNFSVIRLGLDEFSPFLLSALRFAGVALFVALVPKPAASWRDLFLVGLFLFTGQFVLLFFAMEAGMPPGLASVVHHLQGPLTVVLAVAFLGERPSPRNWVGLGIALVGLLLIGRSTGADLTALGLLLTLAGALSWAIGNLVLKRLAGAAILGVTIWSSVIPPLPLFALALVIDGPERTLAALSHISWSGAAVLLYMIVPVTLIGYGIWSRLLQTYSTATAAPFSLLVPCFGLLGAYLIFGEQLTGLRLAGAVLVLSGLALSALPFEQWRGRKKA
jgi:O-acetylserine/cysteine efflux transporter